MRLQRPLVLFAIAFCTAVLAAASGLAQTAAQLPATARLAQPVKVPVIIAGRPSGTVTLPIGTQVTVLASSGALIQISSGATKAWINASAIQSSTGTAPPATPIGKTPPATPTGAADRTTAIPPTPTPNKTPPQPEVRPRPQPKVDAPKLIPSKEFIDAQLKAGRVLPPRGWDALETTLRFRDGKELDGYVYDVRGAQFWYAARDMIQKSARIADLEVKSRLDIVRWRSRAARPGSPSVTLGIDDRTLPASIVGAGDKGLDLLTEAGELMEGIPLARLDETSRAFAEQWLAGKWEPKQTEWAIAPKFTAAMPPFWNGRALVRHEGKWGLVDGSGEFVMAPTFDEATKIPGSSNIKLRQGNKWGLMADGGRIVLKPGWEDVGDLHYGMIPVRSGGLWGYAQEGGKLVIPCTWEDAWRFSFAGTAIVIKNGKRGFVDRSGKVIVKPEWDGALMHTPEGIGAVRRGEGWALVDSKGKLLCDPVWQFRWAERRFELGYIPAWAMGDDGSPKILLGADGRPGATPKLRPGICLPRQPGPLLVGAGRMPFTLVDKAGNAISLEEISDASGGFAAVRKGALWGYADANGLVMEPRWNMAGKFAQGLAAVAKREGPQSSQDPWQFIDSDGNPAFPAISDPQYKIDSQSWQSAPMIENGRISARGPNWSSAWLDDKGKVFSKKQLELPPPGQWLPKAEGKNRVGLLDTTGKVILPPEYEQFDTRSSQWIGIKKDGKWGLADRSGTIVVPPFAASKPLAPLRFFDNGAAMIGNGNRRRIFWPDHTELKDTAVQQLQYAYEYGAELILKRGEGKDLEWWIARREPPAFWKLEGASRIYWNSSLVEFDRIWIQDKVTQRWHFCSIDGKRLGPEMADKPKQWFFDGGMGVIRDGSNCHFIDKEGKKAGVGTWEDARIFSNGMAAVKKAGRWGFIDPTGKLLIDCKYDEVGDFFVASRQRSDQTPKLAAVCLAGRWGYINASDKTVIALEHDARGRLQDGKICFPHPQRKWEIQSAYEPDGKRIEGTPPNMDQVNSKSNKHRHAANWSITENENGLLGLVSDAGVVALKPEWRVIIWVAPGVVAVRDKTFAGGLFSPEKGWLFSEDDNQRILRSDYDGGFDDRFLQNGLILIEPRPKWGFARYRK